MLSSVLAAHPAMSAGVDEVMGVCQGHPLRQVMRTSTTRPRRGKWIQVLWRGVHSAASMPRAYAWS